MKQGARAHRVLPAAGALRILIVKLSSLGDVVHHMTAVTDARRREVYWATYDEDGSRSQGPQVAKPAERGLQCRWIFDEVRLRKACPKVGLVHLAEFHHRQAALG